MRSTARENDDPGVPSPQREAVAGVFAESLCVNSAFLISLPDGQAGLR